MLFHQSVLFQPFKFHIHDNKGNLVVWFENKSVRDCNGRIALLTPETHST